MSIQELVVLILGEVVIEVGVDGIEHFIDYGLIYVGFEFQDGFHELFLGNFSFIGVVCHSKDIPEDQAHLFGTFAEGVDGVDETVDLVFLLDV